MAIQQTTTQTILPEWYTQYAQNVLGRAYAATSEPYQKYEAPRIAGFQPLQQKAFAGYESAVGNYEPYLQSAGQQINRAAGSFTAPGVAQQYMNPYIQNVISGIGATAGRNLYENILPAVNRTFIGGGTFGGSRSAEFTQRAIRDAQAAALDKQVAAMSEGYKTAADLYGTEATRALSAAERYAGLGAQTQEQRAADLARLEAAGGKQQALAQTSADLAYEDFMRQRDYPYFQAQRLAAIGGAPSASGAGTETKTAPGPSTLAQVAGAAGGIAGILGSLGVFKEGGEVEGPVKDGKRNMKHPMHGLGWLKDVR